MAPVMLFDKIVSLTVRNLKRGKRKYETIKTVKENMRVSDKESIFTAGDAAAVFKEWNRPRQVQNIKIQMSKYNFKIFQ